MALKVCVTWRTPGRHRRHHLVPAGLGVAGGDHHPPPDALADDLVRAGHLRRQRHQADVPGRRSRRRRASAASGGRIPAGSWAPARAGLIQGPSRWAPRMVAPPSTGPAASAMAPHRRLQRRRRRRPRGRQQRRHTVAGVEAGHAAQPVRIGVHGVGAVAAVDVHVDEPRQQHAPPAVDHGSQRASPRPAPRRAPPPDRAPGSVRRPPPATPATTAPSAATTVAPAISSGGGSRV